MNSSVYLSGKWREGGLEYLETKITGTKSVGRLGSSWIKLMSRKLGFIHVRLHSNFFYGEFMKAV